MPAGYGPWIADGLNDVLSGATIKAMLVDDTYVPDPDATTAPTSHEVSGTGYTAGGVDVTSLVTLAYDSAANAVKMTLSASVTFGSIVVTGIGGIVFYISGGKPLFVDMFGSTNADGTVVFAYTAASTGALVVQL